MTFLMTGPPTRMRSVSIPFTTTASNCLPASRLPIVSARSSDAAALIVAPTSASSSVRFMPKQASVMTNGIEVVNPPPGLRSVASATATPCSINIRAGA
jgi:hypothetical protein